MDNERVLKKSKKMSKRESVIDYAIHINNIINDLVHKLDPDTFGDVVLVLAQSLTSSVNRYNETSEKLISDLRPPHASTPMPPKPEMQFTKGRR